MEASYAPIYRKPDSECSPITLIMRKYYTAERAAESNEYRDTHKESINIKLRERYHNDPVYKEYVLSKRREYYHRQKKTQIGKINVVVYTIKVWTSLRSSIDKMTTIARPPRLGTTSRNIYPRGTVLRCGNPSTMTIAPPRQRYGTSDVKWCVQMSISSIISWVPILLPIPRFHARRQFSIG